MSIQAAAIGAVDRAERPAVVFHVAATLLVGLLWIGAYLDANWHINFGQWADSFFTPTHYLLHGAWLGTVALIAVYVARARRDGIPALRALPAGHDFFALGSIVWGIAGGVDFAWHTAFGLEAKVEAVYTPSHLALEAGSTLMMLGIIRHSLWRRSHVAPSAATEIPLVAALAYLLANVMWLTWYSDPLTNDFASGGRVAGGISAFSAISYAPSTGEVAGVAGAILSSLATMLVVLFALRHFRLPAGAITLMVAWHSAWQAWVVGSFVYLPAFIAAAVVADVLWSMSRAGERAPSDAAYRIVGAAMPLVGMTLYFATIALVVGGIVWVPHLWVGTVALCTVAGLGASYVVAPPKVALAG